MKAVQKLIISLIIFFIFITSSLALDIESDKAILINLNDNSILYSKNSDEKTSIASLTKMMTAIVVLENIDDLEEQVAITNEDWKGLVEADASTANLVINKKYSYLELLYGLILPSGADCANALSRLVGGTQENFVQMMNDKAEELNLTNTHFANTTGLDDKENYSTASDMAKLLEYGIKNETFKKIITTMTYKTHDGITLTHTIKTYSKRYNISIKGLLGGKTGNTDDAGVCLASIAEYNNISYLLIVLNAKSPYQLKDTKTIYEYYMDNYNYYNLINKNDNLIELNTKYCKEDKVIIKAQENYQYYMENNYDQNLIKLDYQGIETITHNMKKGDKLGQITLYYDNDLKDTIDIYLEEDMSFDLIKYIKDYLIYFIIGILFLITSLILLIILIIRHKNKSKEELIEIL